jgi:hypothetical protein
MSDLLAAAALGFGLLGFGFSLAVVVTVHRVLRNVNALLRGLTDYLNAAAGRIREDRAARPTESTDEGEILSMTGAGASLAGMAGRARKD